MPLKPRIYRPNLLARLFRLSRWKLTLDGTHRDRARLGERDDIRCMGIVDVAITEGLLWHSVKIGTIARVDALTGLSAGGARRLREDLLAFINLHLADVIERSRTQLEDVDWLITSIIVAKSRYLAQSDITQAIATVPASALQALSHPLFDAGRLRPAAQADVPKSLRIFDDPEERRRYNDAFVEHELATFKDFFDDLGGFSLSTEQREACIRLEDSNLLIASAGSGKSATMVGKVAYTIAKGIGEPSEILVLAFNRNAAMELKERIARQLGVGANELECRVTTFHALGLGIIKEVDGKPPQLANWVENAGGEARFINAIVDELVETNADFRTLWLDLLSLYPRADIPDCEFDTIEDYERHIADEGSKHGGGIDTLSGDLVKSPQEQTIANWLWRHSVDFRYEQRMPNRDEDGSIRYVHPDFYYPATKTIHEHFAIRADGTSQYPNYVTHAGLKRAGFARVGADFFETRSAHASDGSLLARLRVELEHRQIPLEEKPFAEIMKAVAPVVVTHYHKIIGICIKHIRASQLTLDMLLVRARSLHDRNRAERFARAVWVITEAYSRKLEQEQRIDFDSMIGDAVRLVETGRYDSPFRFIFVDEFQDISDPRAKLIKALQHQKTSIKLFAVGDDWQSIYRFTGSDITIFTEFEKHFGSSWQGRLEQTYRCNQTLADVAARFVQMNPAQLTKTVRSSRAAIPRSIRAIPVRDERDNTAFRDACLKVLARLDAFLGGNPAQWRQGDEDRLKVLVLWRYNHLDPFRGGIPRFANIVASGLSFHRSKGMEADYTILLDVSEGDYGVPSRIEEDELLNLVIPRPETFEFAEERRLFYVALTRASRGTFLLYNQRKPSRYIRELSRIAGTDVRFETVDGLPLRQCPVCTTGQLVERTGPNGSIFIGCNGYPACRHTEQPGGVMPNG